MHKKNSTVFFYILATLALLLFDTGLHGDDYIVITNLEKSDTLGFLNLEGASIMAFNIVTYYSFWWPYFLFGNEYQTTGKILSLETFSKSNGKFLCHRFR